MAISKRENKFDAAVSNLNENENLAQEKAEKVVKSIAGTDTQTKIITDKNGRKRKVKIPEPRKTMPVYIPTSLYEQFSAITASYAISNNAAICQLIRDYVEEKKSILSEK